MNNRILNCLKPPEIVRGMTKLDKIKFKKNINLFVISIKKDLKLSSVIPLLKKYLLKLENFKPIQDKDNHTEIYLNPSKVSVWTDITEEDRSKLELLNVTMNNMRNVPHEISYENFPTDDILKSVLPTDKEGLASFTKVGHVIHLNLREHLLMYKELIGQVLLDKVPGCKSVVNKTNSIDNTYRNFLMEILAGEDDMIVKLKESGCLFQFNFATVYWNSRLSTEHERIVKMLKPGDVLFDVFAGVGPFSIPAAKKKCLVHANDLNPESYKWLDHNVKINKINKNNITTYNKDGKVFIIEDVKEILVRYLRENVKVYITMNLPALATEFINTFHKLYTTSEFMGIDNYPTLFLYCFAKGDDPIRIGKDLVNKGMGFNIEDKIKDIFKVRTVSSFKEMLRITITLDEEILVGSRENLKRKTVKNENIFQKKS